MSALQQEVARLAQQPSGERIQALQRMIPRAAVQAARRATGSHHRHCPRLLTWFMV